MTNEIVKEINRVFNANAEKQLSLSVVLNTTCQALKKDPLTGNLYSHLIGDSGSKERKDFMQRFMLCMPHIVINGKVVAVDWVAADSEKSYETFFDTYRLSSDSEQKKLTCKVNQVTDKREVVCKEVVTLASGYQMEVVSKDKDGNNIKEEKEVILVPREKAIWGYTEVVKNAIITALASYE